MNTKKIRLQDCHCNGTMPLRVQPPVSQLPEPSTELPSPPFHQRMFMSPAPQHHHKQYSGAGCPREEHYAAEPAFAQSCVSSGTTAEDLVGIAQFDLPPFGMFPPATATAADRRLFRSLPSSELLRQLDTVMLRLRADQLSSSVRTYLVRPQRRDATEAELPLPAPPEHDHGLCAKTAPSTTVPPRDAPGSSLQSLIESYLSARSCVGAPATASHARSSNSNAAQPAARPSKTRIRWTRDLHERFVECVNQLGGADKATPKRIMKLMNSDGLTIYHIKSHLQKHRMTKCTPPPSSSSSDGNQHEKWGDKQNPEPKTGMHITEALRVQLDLQRRLHDQLEMQRKLQEKIEEQGKMLHKMFKRHLKASGSNGPVPSRDHDDEDDVLFPAAMAEQHDAVFVDIFMDDGDDGMKLLSYDDEL